MFDSTEPPPPSLARIRRYRWLMLGAILGGTAGLVVAFRLGAPLVGVAVYWLGFLAFLGIWKGTSVQLYDERDAALERRASLHALQIVGLAGIVGIPALVALAETTDYELPAAVTGAFYAYVALFLLYGASYTWLRYRP